MLKDVPVDVCMCIEVRRLTALCIVLVGYIGAVRITDISLYRHCCVKLSRDVLFFAPNSTASTCCAWTCNVQLIIHGMLYNKSKQIEASGVWAFVARHRGRIPPPRDKLYTSLHAMSYNHIQMSHWHSAG